jgi:hypothetical protein
MAYFARGVGSMIARRLLHKDFLSFSEFSIEICTLDVNTRTAQIEASFTMGAKVSK